MNAIRAEVAREGLLPREDRAMPKVALAVSIYRSDLLFRSLVDLTVVGAGLAA